MQVFRDYEGLAVRLTDERFSHIRRRPEMVGQETKIGETCADPDVVIESRQDPSVRLYHRLYQETPVTRKYLLVAVKILTGDAFVVRTLFTDRQTQGSVRWAR